MNDGLSSMEKVPTIVYSSGQWWKMSYNEGVGNIDKLQLHDEAYK